jgi:uncharacterized membrane protein (UPF0127 family)
LREKIGLVYKNKKIIVSDVKRLSKFGRGIGLMFHRREQCPAMLFEFKKPVSMAIHSFFVFFPFVGIWMDNKNKITEIKVIPSWKISISPRKKFYKLLEIPINKKYRREIMLLVEGQKDL